MKIAQPNIIDITPESSVLIIFRGALKEGLTDIFPDPFENSLLKRTEFQRVIQSEIVKAVSGGSLESLRMQPIVHVLLPKTTAFDFRRCALIHPIDTLKYLSLAISIADEIEAHRPPIAKKIVFSYRYAPSKGYLFNQKYTISAFQRHTQAKARQKRIKVLVSCDIANFYDRLNLHSLESILLSIGIDKVKVSLVNQLLLSWSNRDSYGLPVGSNASRILAEAALIEVDRYLISIGAEFCRYVDDYRFFAPNATVAHYWLTQLIERLWLEGLTINKSKTKIEDVASLSNSASSASEQQPKMSSHSAELAANSEKRPFRIVAGYGGTIPTRFRQASATEKKKLGQTSAEELLAKINEGNLASPEDVLAFIKSSIYTKKFILLQQLPLVLNCFPQFVPYAVDALIKNCKDIDETVRSSLREAFSAQLSKDSYLPEYIAISLIRLLGAEGYREGKVLLAQFRALRRNAGAYIGRVLLDSLEEVVSRGEVLEIRRYFVRADAWEKRQIIRIALRHLHEEENRAWLKGVRIQEGSDSFLIELISPASKAKSHKRARNKRSRSTIPKMTTS
jgi:hypothetical protein